MKKKRIMAILLAVTMFVAALTGCGNGGGETATDSKTDTKTDTKTNIETDIETDTETDTKEEVVELSFYMMNGPVNDQERIMAKANEIIGEKLNVKLNIVMIDGASYAEKMNLMINSGDKWDLCFTASWGGINYFENASKGAYADLTDLIPIYAPETYARIPEGLWDGVKVDGKIYGLVNYQQWGVAKRDGLRFRSDIAEECGFDWVSIKEMSTIDALKTIDTFLGEALAIHPDMIGFETSSNWSLFANEPLMWDMESVGDVAIPGWVRFEDPAVVINQFETEEFKEYCNIMRDWFEKGYVRKDGATIKDTTPDRKAAKFIAEHSQGWPDSVDFPENIENTSMSMCTPDNAPAVAVSMTRTIIPAAAGSTAAIAINSQSPNIERALQLVELLNTDDELYMLITQGEEDTDYIYDDEGTFTLVDGMYNFNWNEWQIGQSYSPDFTRGGYNRNESGEIQKQAQMFVFEADRVADVSPMSGFTFDSAPVKTQIANCSAVITEMVPALSSGSVDPQKVLPEFLQRLETAGISDIIAEKQAQLDAWSNSK